MIISSSPTPRIIDDYDVVLASGHMMPISLDRAAGDTIDTDSSPLVIKFYLAPKPTQNDPDVMLPAEDITLFVAHIISISHRTRELTPASPELQEQFRTLHKLSPTIQ
jgi:hypothetical protein